jgi:hypothetical protein
LNHGQFAGLLAFQYPPARWWVSMMVPL